jgi:FAD/FMN-containing dehydrogenase
MLAARRKVEFVNDVHSKLNPTRVRYICNSGAVETIRQEILRCKNEGMQLAIAGGRHAMGAQQFATDMVLVDTSNLNHCLNFDRDRGLIEVEPGIRWPELINWLRLNQQGPGKQWSVAQKQTGADRLSVGGAVSANIHGRGLKMRPFVSDIESFILINADGELIRCDRHNNRELFALVAGGYGLFGLIVAVTLRLVPRRLLRRHVELILVDELIERLDSLVEDGCVYGDYQFAIDGCSKDFMRLGILSAYKPEEISSSAGDDLFSGQRVLTFGDWQDLVHLAHVDKSRAFKKYSDHYLATDGQFYWSDHFQLSTYLDNYHDAVDEKLGVSQKGSEIITELYVPRVAFPQFMRDIAKYLCRENANLIYGTVRIVERDDETFLPWASNRFACVVLNIHTNHTVEGVANSARLFQTLIDMAIVHGGSYYLTYHKFATRAQVERCYPRFPEFLNLKQKYDPLEIFQSDWYRHYKGGFALP